MGLEGIEAALHYIVQSRKIMMRHVEEKEAAWNEVRENNIMIANMEGSDISKFNNVKSQIFNDNPVTPVFS